MGFTVSIFLMTRCYKVLFEEIRKIECKGIKEDKLFKLREGQRYEKTKYSPENKPEKVECRVSTLKSMKINEVRK